MCTESYLQCFSLTQLFMGYLCAWKNCLYSWQARLWQGPLSPYSGGRGCSDTVPLARLLFPPGNLCTTDSEEEASTCRCLWVIIMGLEALYESQDGDKKIIFYRSLSVTGSQMYLFFFSKDAHSVMIMRENFMEACGITHVSGRILGQTREQCLGNMNQMNTLYFPWKGIFGRITWRGVHYQAETQHV